jgi:UDP:flavonoid glycosyltransferase YjiC (YdhE family)
MRWATAPRINHERAKQGLPPLRDPFSGDVQTADLALFPVSRFVARPAPDWPARYHLTGYWFLDHDEGWEPDAALLNFLAAGPPPVVISLGSMLNEDPRGLTRLLARAVERAGCRAIIQQGWGDLGSGVLPPTVHATGYAPHRWLFSRAAAVVHHGGAGTSGAVFRAGVPSVVIPHIADQPLWAAVARSLGVAGPAVPHRQLTAERLSRALAATLANPRFARVAAALGERLRSEDGVGTARRLIEQMLASRSPRDEALTAPD